MATPTFSKRQEKKTLSSKKPKKETIKNVLAQPYKSYWPLISPEDNTSLKQTLDKLLPRIKTDKPKIPYSVIKTIPKADRKHFRNNFSKSPQEIKKSDTDNLIFGVNDVSRLIQKQEAGAVLVASDVKPRLLVQHVLDQAVLFGVPTLVVTDLRDIFKSKCGISSVVVAINKSVEPETQLGLIQQAVCNIQEKYPVPESHINFNRSLIFEDISQSVIEMSDSVVTLPDSDEIVANSVKSAHLIRDSCSVRAFVPAKSSTGQVGSPVLMEVDEAGFLAFTASETACNYNNGHKRKVNYSALTVKKLKGDKNRGKRKIENFRKRK